MNNFMIRLWRRLFGKTVSAPQRDQSEREATPIDTLEAAGDWLAQRSLQPLRPFSTRDFGREEFHEARSVLVPLSQAEPLLLAVRSRLGPGLVVFIGTQTSHARPRPKGVEVVVGCGSSQFDILRIAASDAINYGKETEDLVRQLQLWNAAFGIDIIQAETDTIRLRLKSMPGDLHKFTKEVYEFCPDIVDQGVGSVDELEQAIRASKMVQLWWD